MNTGLSPAEFAYLDRTYWPDGVQLLKFTIQELCLLKVLTVTKRQTVENIKDRRTFPRYYFTRGPQFGSLDNTSKSHSFFINLFHGSEELKFSELRNKIMKALQNDPDNFPKNCTRPDLIQKDYLLMRYFKSRTGNEAFQKISRLLDETDLHIDDMLAKDMIDLQKNLEQLGTCVLLLEEATIKKLKIISKDVAAIRSLEFMSILDSQFDSFDTYFYMSGFSFDISSGSSGSDFGGFGGGDFSGGGAGSDW